jgi:hypothetical protein
MINPAVLAVTSITLQALTNDELAALNLTIALGGDVKSKPWYGKVKSLFTEQNGNAMHSETVNAVSAIAFQRLS